jgi:hypothetical protein
MEKYHSYRSKTSLNFTAKDILKEIEMEIAKYEKTDKYYKTNIINYNRSFEPFKDW